METRSDFFAVSSRVELYGCVAYPPDRIQKLYFFANAPALNPPLEARTLLASIVPGQLRGAGD
jgi:hypothetical protein